MPKPDQIAPGGSRSRRIEHGFGRGIETVFDAEHEREQAGSLQRAFGEQVAREMTIAAVEQFDLRQHADGPDARGHLADVARRVDHDLAARIHGVEIERADIGPQELDMLDPPLRRHQGGARTGHLGIVFRRHEASAGARGQVDDQARFLARMRSITSR